LSTEVRTAVVAVVLAAAFVLGNATAARADLGDPVNCIEDPTNPVCAVEVETSGSSDGGGGAGTCHDVVERPVPCYIEGKGWLGEFYCWWRTPNVEEAAFLDERGYVVEPPEYWYVGTCGDYYTGEWTTEPYFYAMTVNPGVTLLAQRAVEMLELPAPRIELNPSGSAPQVAFVPTWLWIDPVVWGSRSAMASAGGLSVTATGVPVQVVWSTGDGQTVVCGPGTPWVSGTDPAAGSPDCGHTYTSASRSAPGGRLAVTASITWRVSWVGGGTSGTEPALTSTASVPVLVVESSALTTG